MTTTETTTLEHLSRALTDDTLAARLQTAFDSPKSFSPTERAALVAEAVRRLVCGRKAEAGDALEPLERARQAGQLARAFTECAEYFSRQRAQAVREAVEAGASHAAVGNELGITRGMVSKILGRAQDTAEAGA